MFNLPNKKFVAIQNYFTQINSYYFIQGDF